MVQIGPISCHDENSLRGTYYKQGMDPELLKPIYAKNGSKDIRIIPQVFSWTIIDENQSPIAAYFETEGCPHYNQDQRWFLLDKGNVSKINNIVWS